MRRAKVYRYSLPMDAGVVLRNQRLNTREGLLVQLWHNHRSGWGEIAPLPGFSPESLEQAQLALLPLLDRWQRGEAFPDCVLPLLPHLFYSKMSTSERTDLGLLAGTSFGLTFYRLPHLP